MSTERLSWRMRHIEQELRTDWLGHPVTVLDQVDSTNRYAKQARLEMGARHGAVVWADQQTQGRGRLGKVWHSPAGQNIYLSILLEPPRTYLTGLQSLLAGIAVIRTVRALTGLDARMKWPNDGVIHGKKFCGILVEAGLQPSPWCVMGIGLNVFHGETIGIVHATSLQDEWSGVLSREDLVVHLLQVLEEVYATWMIEGNVWLTAEWAKYSATLGECVKVTRPGQDDVVGVAEAIDTDGALLVRADGHLHTVIAGEVSIRLADGRYAPDRF